MGSFEREGIRKLRYICTLDILVTYKKRISNYCVLSLDICQVKERKLIKSTFPGQVRSHMGKNGEREVKVV